MTRAWYKQSFYYNEEFVLILNTFLSLIKSDDDRFGNPKESDKEKKTDSQRISKAIRYLITAYTQDRLQEIKTEKTIKRHHNENK